MTYYPPNPTIDTELGRERLCRGCLEYWPVDADFWYFGRNGKVMGRCRACWSERRRHDGLGQSRRFAHRLSA